MPLTTYGFFFFFIHKEFGSQSVAGLNDLSTRRGHLRTSTEFGKRSPVLTDDGGGVGLGGINPSTDVAENEKTLQC